ncbi:MAG: hypothetical protein AAFU77_09925 [Myxococcota bacterium]
MAELVSVTKDVWVAKAPLALPGGIEVGATMTVVRLADRGLWIHSPIPLNQALVTELDALGEVRWIVAPNLLHHLFLGAGIRQGFVLRVFAKDRSAWKASMAKLFALPFENLLMAHGSPVCGDARAQAWATCAWGLPSESISMLRAGDKS